MAHIKCDFRSEILDMGTSMTVILPENKKGRSTKVVYLLHGLGDNSTGWTRYTSVERYAREYGIALVIPEVGRSFYCDMKYGLNYFSFIHKELPSICHNMFGFSRERERNYIMGLSMGGYGALKSLLTSPSTFAGCALFSSLIDIKGRIKEKKDEEEREFKAIFGPSLVLSNRSDLLLKTKRTSINKLPPIYMACGKDDDFIEQNRNFAASIKNRGANVVFEEWSGEHNWKFWDEAVKRAFDYFFRKEEP